jgi:hypothetical protein
MLSVTESDAIDEAKRGLKKDYPDWSIVHTDTGRWWAMQPGIGELIADDPDMLRQLLDGMDE